MGICRHKKLCMKARYNSKSLRYLSIFPDCFLGRKFAYTLRPKFVSALRPKYIASSRR